MRTLTVDTQALTFLSKIFLAIVTVGVCWFAWLPFQHMFTHDNNHASAFEFLNWSEYAAIAKRLSMDDEEVATFSALMRQGRFISVDVGSMRLAIYDGIDILESVDILHMPDTDSSNNISGGVYAFDEKADTKLSTVTMVRFPHYMRFGDRYALHGTPTGAHGEVLHKEYPGALIELSNEDAKKIYEYVVEGMPIYVRTVSPPSGDMSTEEFSLLHRNMPATSAEAYALVDLMSGQTFLIKNGGARYPVASITKLVTAAVATDSIGHGSEVVAPDGRQYTLGELYYPLLLHSNNAVAHRIATHVGTPYFLSNMNTYVRALGMTQSSFADSSGLSPKNISTVIDLTRLAQHLYDDKTFLLDISSEKDMTITSSTGHEWYVVNQNKLSSDPHFRGGKLGYTDEAGQTSLAIFNVPLADEVRPVAVIILQSKDWKQDTRTLLRWLVTHVGEAK